MKKRHPQQTCSVVMSVVVLILALARHTEASTLVPFKVQDHRWFEVTEPFRDGLSSFGVASTGPHAVIVGGWNYQSQPNLVTYKISEGGMFSTINSNAEHGPVINPLLHTVSTPSSSGAFVPLLLMGGKYREGPFFQYRTSTWKTIDGGATWTEVSTNSGFDGMIEHTCVYTGANDQEIFIIGGMNITNGRSSNLIYKSTNQGLSFDVYESGRTNWRRVQCGYLNGKHFALGGNDGSSSSGGQSNLIYRSNDGLNWDEIDTYPPTLLNRPSLRVVYDRYLLLMAGWRQEIGLFGDSYFTTDVSTFYQFANNSDVGIPPDMGYILIAAYVTGRYAHIVYTNPSEQVQMIHIKIIYLSPQALPSPNDECILEKGKTCGSGYRNICSIIFGPVDNKQLCTWQGNPCSVPCDVSSAASQGIGHPLVILVSMMSILGWLSA